MIPVMTITKNQLLPIRLDFTGHVPPELLPGNWRSSKPAVAKVNVKSAVEVEIDPLRLGRTLITWRPGPGLTTVPMIMKTWVQVVRKRSAVKESR